MFQQTLLAALVVSAVAQAQVSPYPRMAPVDQYMMARDAEIALARSAAPPSISQDASILVMGRKGYETGSNGRNCFVCVVQRSWTANIDEPEFWNPKLRAPICFNAPAARSFLPLTIKRTELALAGRSKTQIFDGVKAAFDKKELPALESGAMCYMMSKQGHLNDQAGAWHPHVMIFVAGTDPAVWGADLPGSPVISSKDDSGRLTVFMIPVSKWSDGSDSMPMGQGSRERQ